MQGFFIILFCLSCIYITTIINAFQLNISFFFLRFYVLNCVIFYYLFFSYLIYFIHNLKICNKSVLLIHSNQNLVHTPLHDFLALENSHISYLIQINVSLLFHILFWLIYDLNLIFLLLLQLGNIVP